MTTQGSDGSRLRSKRVNYGITEVGASGQRNIYNRQVATQR